MLLQTVKIFSFQFLPSCQVKQLRKKKHGREKCLHAPFKNQKTIMIFIRCLKSRKICCFFTLTSTQIIPYQSSTVYGRAPYIQQLYFHFLIPIVLEEKIVFVHHGPPFLVFPPSSFVFVLHYTQPLLMVVGQKVIILSMPGTTIMESTKGADKGEAVSALSPCCLMPKTQK